MTIEIRAITDDELGEFSRIPAYVLADPTTAEAGMRADWTTCAFVDGRLATAFGTWPLRVRLNGRRVRMGGVTLVGTWPEFRRRGLMRQVMTKALAEQRDRGQSLAILWASMGAIYQRFGYGLATSFVFYDVDPTTIGFNDGVSATGKTEVADIEGGRPIAVGIYDNAVGPANLMIERAAPMWDAMLREPDKVTNRVGIYRNGDGVERGYVIYRLTNIEGPPDPGPNQRLDVIDYIALDHDALRGLWEFLAAHDLVRQIHWEGVAPDDPSPHLLLEPRQLRRGGGDGVWMRVVDVEAAVPQRPLWRARSAERRAQR